MVAIILEEKSRNSIYLIVTRNVIQSNSSSMITCSTPIYSPPKRAKLNTASLDKESIKVLI